MELTYGASELIGCRAEEDFADDGDERRERHDVRWRVTKMWRLGPRFGCPDRVLLMEQWIFSGKQDSFQ